MIKDTVEKVRGLFKSRVIAYRGVFDKDNVYTLRVLRDLAKFCRAHESTYHKDPRVHAVLEGRREVFLRIQEHLQLTPDELLELHKIKEIMKGDQ